MKNLVKNIICISSIAVINIAYAETISVNVFANVDNNIDTTIKQVNDSFNSSGLYQKYQIKPFMNNHKIHLTMYLTDYNSDKINTIESMVKEIANSTNGLTFQDSDISLKSSNFLMLDVKNNVELQILSDKITAELMNIRDKTSIIPEWAKNNPLKNNMFTRYGSPNVFEGFDPHFSIFVANITPESQAIFASEINQQISQFKFKSQTYKINSIGVGITDKNGQIIKILATYNLKNNN